MARCEWRRLPWLYTVYSHSNRDLVNSRWKKCLLLSASNQISDLTMQNYSPSSISSTSSSSGFWQRGYGQAALTWTFEMRIRPAVLGQKIVRVFFLFRVLPHLASKD